MSGMEMTRRAFIASGAALAASPLAAPPALAGEGDPRLVVVILAGGLDGLAAVPPLGDPLYRTLEGGSRPDAGRALSLDGAFGLHPALRFLEGRYCAGEALVWHAAATPYRGGSHREAMTALQSGGGMGDDGWLNRAAAARASDGAAPLPLLAIGGTMPRLLRGRYPAALCTPEGLAAASPGRLADILSAAPSARIAAARGMTGSARPDPRSLFVRLGQLLAEPAGPRLASLTLDGWDTHAAIGDCLAPSLSILDEGLAGLREGAGAAWRRTAVLVVSEFGRAVRPNASGGTDHGLATAGFLVGGAVAGGRVLCDWPGLAARQLYAGHALAPTRDVREIMASVLRDHLGLRDDAARAVFPGVRRLSDRQLIHRHHDRFSAMA